MNKINKELKLWAKDDIVPTDLQVLCRKAANRHNNLLKALKKYGDHLGTCYENLRMGKCNCGLHKTIAKAEKD